MTVMKGDTESLAGKASPKLDAARAPLALAGKKVEEQKKQWNTKNLGLRLGSDALSAASAAALVAPIISIIDK
jgi:hypothetical protein